MPITPPIFIRSDDLLSFSSVEEAASYIEPVDVEPTDKGYDAEGRLLRVLVRGEVKSGPFGIDQRGARVEILQAEETPGHAEELRVLLADWLGRVRPAPDLPSANLSELVARVRALTTEAEAGGRRMMRVVFIGLVALLALWAWWRVSRR